MAINPLIPLQVQPPQIPNLLEQAGQMLSLRSLMQQNQLGQQRIAQNELALESQMQQNKDQLLVQQAYAAKNGDLEEVYKETFGKISPAASMELRKSADEERRRLLAESDEDWDREGKKLDRLGNITSGLLLTDDNTLAANWPMIRAQVINSGDVDPQMIPEKFPGRQILQLYANMIDGGKAARARAEEERKAAKERREEAEEERRKAQEARRETEEERKQELFPFQRTEAQAKAEAAERGKLLTPEEEAQEIRIRQAGREPKETSDKKLYDDWFVLTRDANSRLMQENRARLSNEYFTGPLATVPSGTELFNLQQQNKDAGPRQWGGGQRMSQYLAKQYVNWAKEQNPEGSEEEIKSEAMRMVMADGWDIRR